MAYMTKTNLRKRGVVARRALKELNTLLNTIEELEDEALVMEAEAVDLWAIRQTIREVQDIVKRIETDGVDQLNGIDRGLVQREW